MLKTTDFIREFPINHKTDRDVENVVLEEYIQKLANGGKIESLLDVGAFGTAAKTHYGKAIRPFIKRYDGIDILFDPIASQLLDNYYAGNAIDYSYEMFKYDTVICVSALEHAGLSTYKGDHLIEQSVLFERCLELAQNNVWFSFPVGQTYVYPDELSVIIKDQYNEFLDLAITHGFEVSKRFFYTQGAPAEHPWGEHTKLDIAFKIPYIDFIGNQSIGVLELKKK